MVALPHRNMVELQLVPILAQSLPFPYTSMAWFLVQEVAFLTPVLPALALQFELELKIVLHILPVVCTAAD